MKVTFIGLTITSSWGNGHATTYRGLLRALALRGHDLTFLEHDKPWYARDRDHVSSPHYSIHLYNGFEELKTRHSQQIADSDLVVLGSFVPEARELAPWLRGMVKGVLAFYDIDTPVTLHALRGKGCEYLEARMIPEFDLYLSFSGGEALHILEQRYGARCARALYCSVDPEIHYPEHGPREWLLGYLGTYSDDRQATLEGYLLEPARRMKDRKFVIAGPGYPHQDKWPVNVQVKDHLPPDEHRSFYDRQQLTLNVTRAPMIALGHSPSVRLFEAAACGTPILSDHWKGLGELFRENDEILIARTGDEAMDILNNIHSYDLQAMAQRARDRVLQYHTSTQRAVELEDIYEEVTTTHERDLPLAARR